MSAYEPISHDDALTRLHIKLAELDEAIEDIREFIDGLEDDPTATLLYDAEEGAILRIYERGEGEG